jgi:hypothetical protein
VNSLDHVENLIVDKAEGCFDDSNSRENLHIPLRIASDFYKFLVKFGDQPPVGEVDYMMGTIRSGFDWFFALAYQCGVVTGSENWRFSKDFDGSFPALRAEFVSSYDRLAKDPGPSAEKALEALLSLTQLEFMFVAQHFPSALFASSDRIRSPH